MRRRDTRPCNVCWDGSSDTRAIRDRVHGPDEGETKLAVETSEMAMAEAEVEGMAMEALGFILITSSTRSSSCLADITTLV